VKANRLILAIAACAAIVAVGFWLRSQTRHLVHEDAPTSQRPHAATGDELYEGFCESCHGADGTGRGLAAAYCRFPPADFTRASFKIRSTPTGSLPSDEDLANVIRHGAGGDGGMPSFAFLANEDVTALIVRIKRFSSRWQRESPPPALVLPARVTTAPERGARVYAAWGCAACHGSAGVGDGPRAAELRDAKGRPEHPTDFTQPSTYKGGHDEAGIVRSTLTGFNGTSMTAFSLPPGGESAVWDLAAYLRSLQKSPDLHGSPVDTTTVDGYWMTPVPEQSGDLSAVSCSVCHRAQFRDWSGSRHAVAMGAGVWAQMNDDQQLAPSCARCHAPLRNQWSDRYLSADGVSCGGCHSRDRQKFGPPRLETTILPLVARYQPPHGPAQTRTFFESVDFCSGCHQFKPGEAQEVHGTFLQNTVEEWRQSRAAREGKTCQTCHMPDRRHLFRGVHDAEMVASGVNSSFDARRDGDRVIARLTLTNSNTGHNFPTYVVPEVWMRIEAVSRDGASRPVAERLVARKVAFASGRWSEVSDTRLRPDETATLDFNGPVPAGTVALVGGVIVRPDAWHEQSLEVRLQQTRSPASRRSYESALAVIRKSMYVLFRSERPLLP
jgi:mono/diheme cytochrome c family protein